MRFLSLALMLVFSQSILAQQKTKKVKTELTDNIYEVYYVLKKDGITKHGTYEKYKQPCQGCKRNSLVKGKYILGKKVGFWYSIPEIYKAYYDSEGKLKWKVFTNPFSKHQITQDYKGIWKVKVTQGRKITYFDSLRQKEEFISKDVKWNGLLQNKKREGLWSFDYNNYSYTYLNYKVGKLQGLSIAYFRNKDTMAKAYYNLGKLIWRINFYQNGDTMSHYRIEKGITKYHKFFKEGKIHQTIIAKNKSIVSANTFEFDGTPIKELSITNGSGVLQISRLSDTTIRPFKAIKFKDGCAIAYKELNVTESKKSPDEKTDYNKSLMYKPRKYCFEYHMLLNDSIHHTLENRYFGGEQGIHDFFVKYYNMPPSAQELGVSGVLMLEFSVGSSGEPGDFQFMHIPLRYGLEDEFLRILKTSAGNWMPSYYHGLPQTTFWRFPLEVDNDSGF